MRGLGGLELAVLFRVTHSVVTEIQVGQLIWSGSVRGPKSMFTINNFQSRHHPRKQDAKKHTSWISASSRALAHAGEGRRPPLFSPSHIPRAISGWPAATAVLMTAAMVAALDLCPRASISRYSTVASLSWPTAERVRSTVLKETVSGEMSSCAGFILHSRLTYAVVAGSTSS